MTGHNVQQLRTAIHEAEAGGMDLQLLESARQELAEEEGKQAALNERKIASMHALKEAIASRDIEQLRGAIREGEAAGLDPQHLEVARQVLAEEERKQAGTNTCQSSASSAVEAGITSSDVEKLHEATQGQGLQARTCARWRYQARI